MTLRKKANHGIWADMKKSKNQFNKRKFYSLKTRNFKVIKIYKLTKQVIIFVGGKGNRLRPLTKNMPKPLIEINNKPFLFYLIQQLENFQFTEVILLTGYKSSKFITFKNNYQKYFNLKINIIKQPVQWQLQKAFSN